MDLPARFPGISDALFASSPLSSSTEHESYVNGEWTEGFDVGSFCFLSVFTCNTDKRKSSTYPPASDRHACSMIVREDLGGSRKPCLTRHYCWFSENMTWNKICSLAVTWVQLGFRPRWRWLWGWGICFLLWASPSTLPLALYWSS